MYFLCQFTSRPQKLLLVSCYTDLGIVKIVSIRLSVSQSYLFKGSAHLLVQMSIFVSLWCPKKGMLFFPQRKSICIEERECIPVSLLHDCLRGTCYEGGLDDMSLACKSSWQVFCMFWVRVTCFLHTVCMSVLRVFPHPSSTWNTSDKWQDMLNMFIMFMSV